MKKVMKAICAAALAGFGLMAIFWMSIVYERQGKRKSDRRNRQLLYIFDKGGERKRLPFLLCEYA